MALQSLGPRPRPCRIHWALYGSPHNHGRRFSLKLIAIIPVRFLSLSTHSNSQQWFITLTRICGLNCEIDSVRYFRHSSSLALFLTKKLSLPLIRYHNFHFSFIPKPDVCTFIIPLSPAAYQIQSQVSTPVVETPLPFLQSLFVLFIVSPALLNLPFLVYCFQAPNICLLLTPAVILLSYISVSEIVSGWYRLLTPRSQGAKSTIYLN